jgi:hypothetical protein
VCASLDADAIAGAVEAALALEPGAGDVEDIEVLLVRGGTSFPIESARLANVGAALLQRAGQILPN